MENVLQLREPHIRQITTVRVGAPVTPKKGPPITNLGGAVQEAALVQSMFMWVSIIPENARVHRLLHLTKDVFKIRNIVYIHVGGIKLTSFEVINIMPIFLILVYCST